MKRDILRIIEKVEEYSRTQKDPHGYKFVKDSVRMMFHFESVAALEIGMKNLIQNSLSHSSSSSSSSSISSGYTILEVKLKLNSILHNVTVVIGFIGRKAEKIIGEVQLVAEFGENSANAHFVDHLDYELRRMWDSSNEAKAEDVCERGHRLMLKFNKTILKVYTHCYQKNNQKLKVLEDNCVPKARDIDCDEKAISGGSKIVFKAIWNGKEVAVGQLHENKDSAKLYREAEIWSRLSRT